MSRKQNGVCSKRAPAKSMQRGRVEERILIRKRDEKAQRRGFIGGYFCGLIKPEIMFMYFLKCYFH